MINFIHCSFFFPYIKSPSLSFPLSFPQVESLTLILMVVAAKYSPNVILLTIGSLTCVLFLLLILALTVPVDFSKWTVVFLILFLIAFVFAVTVILSIYTFNFPIFEILYAMLIVVILSIAMLMNLQVLFNGAIFELYPDDFILGAILMFADVMWVQNTKCDTTSCINLSTWIAPKSFWWEMQGWTNRWSYLGQIFEILVAIFGILGFKH